MTEERLSLGADPRRVGLKQIKAVTLKPVDAWWTVLVVDPVAVRVIWLMARLRAPVTPEGITWVSLAVGLASGGCFADGRYVLGAVLYEVSFFLDCLDGKWSRLTGASTERGAFLDGLTGTIVLVAVVSGLGFHERSHSGGALAIAGMSLLLCVRAISNYLTIYLQTPDPRVHTVFRPEPGGWLARHRLLAPMSFPDRHVLLFVVAPLTGVVGPMFVAIAALELAMQGRKGQILWRRLTAAGPAEAPT